MKFQTVCWGRIDAAGVLLAGRNMTSSRFGAGIFDLTIGGGVEVDGAELMPTIVPEGVGGAAIPDFINTSDTVKRVQFYTDAGGAVDVQFYFRLDKLDLI
jgi:hypothetical protein